MIVIIRSNSIIGDPRVEKYINYIKTQQKDFRIIGWNRTGDKIIANNTIYYKRQVGYNVGGAKAAINRIRWFLFVIRTLFQLKDVKIIHGCDLDCAFPAVLYKILGHWNTKIIFDIFDWYSATLSGQAKWIKSSFRIMEWITTKFSNHLIICEEERIRQIPYDIVNKYSVLSNIPSFDDDSFLKINESPYFHNNKYTLTYVGGLYNERFLEELLDCAEQGYFNLLIAGYGDIALEKRCKQLNRLDNVIYFGKVQYKDGLNIMYNADIIYAMYCISNPNHIYAAPNKLYEAMFLSKPIISTKGTIVGEKIDKLNIGYSIEEKSENLIQLINNITKEDIKKLGQNSYALWENTYKNSVELYMNNTYKNLISENT